MHLIDGEWWFLIRHGDTFTRTAKVDKQKTEVLHFRSAKDDVVVYSPERDEIRIYADTKGEKELYRTAFGTRLTGAENHFSERMLTGRPIRFANQTQDRHLPGWLTRRIPPKIE